MCVTLTRVESHGGSATVGQEECMRLNSVSFQQLPLTRIPGSPAAIAILMDVAGKPLARRPVSCKPSSLTLFDGRMACLLCPSENGNSSR